MDGSGSYIKEFFCLLFELTIQVAKVRGGSLAINVGPQQHEMRGDGFRSTSLPGEDCRM